MDYDYETEKTLEVPKERSKWRIHYMARYVNGKPQILQLAGQRYMKIYRDKRGFVEIDKTEFERLAKLLKEGAVG